MDWEPEQLNLGALGFAGICRETYRVLLRAILPNKGGRGAATLMAFFLANHALDSSAHVLGEVAYNLSKLVCVFLIFVFTIIFTATYALRVATLYCTDGDSDASVRIVREVPDAPLRRLYLSFLTVLPLAYLYITLSVLAWVELPQLDPSDKVVVLALQLLGGATFLAGAAYIAVLSHVVCVVSLLDDLDEDDIMCFGAVRKSRTLLAGKFWAAGAVFVPLDGCLVALQMYFPDIVFGDALGLGRGFQVVAGAAMAVALWAVLVVTLVAQPVVYLVCKNHHHEVVDKVHLNYVGEYQSLAVDGDTGVELQQVETTPQPTATSAAQATDQSPAGTTST